MREHGRWKKMRAIELIPEKGTQGWMIEETLTGSLSEF